MGYVQELPGSYKLWHAYLQSEPCPAVPRIMENRFVLTNLSAAVAIVGPLASFRLRMGSVVVSAWSRMRLVWRHSSHIMAARVCR